MASQRPKTVFGAAPVGRFTPETLTEFINLLEQYHVKEIDTAYVYPNSESTLGKAGVPKKFSISTKAPAFGSGAMGKQNVIDGMSKSLTELKADSVDIYYLHGPDKTTPIEETLQAIQQLYAEGKFKRFGLSNFQPADVQKIYDIQSAAKSVLPSVFQGNYNPVSRGVESSLFPTLHKLKISFYAYSPIAGGFLAKDSKSVRAKELEGRWATGTLNGDLYNTLYGKESLYKALDEWEEIAKEAGVTKAALAYRWAFWHSLLRESNGDAVIVGASKVWQFEETLKAIEDGPLTKKTLDAIEQLWKTVEHDAPLDNYHDFLSKLK